MHFSCLVGLSRLLVRLAHAHDDLEGRVLQQRSEVVGRDRGLVFFLAGGRRHFHVPRILGAVPSSLPLPVGVLLLPLGVAFGVFLIPAECTGQV
jgi:hypothetical protein